MALDIASLGSVTSTLEDLTARIGTLAAACDDTDDSGTELREVERQLEAATRRLTAILRRARP